MKKNIDKINYIKYKNFSSFPSSLPPSFSPPFILSFQNNAYQKLLGSEAWDRKAYLAKVAASWRCVGGSCEKGAPGQLAGRQPGKASRWFSCEDWPYK